MRFHCILWIVCQLSVSCLSVVCQLSASCCQRRAVGDGRATASSKRQAASSRRQAAGVQAPSGQRRLTDVWRRAANAQLSSLSRALASIPTPLVARSIGGRNNRETVSNDFEMFSLLRISRVRRPPTVPNFKVGLWKVSPTRKSKNFELGGARETKHLIKHSNATTLRVLCDPAISSLRRGP